MKRRSKDEDEVSQDDNDDDEQWLTGFLDVNVLEVNKSKWTIFLNTKKSSLTLTFLKDYFFLFLLFSSILTFEIIKKFSINSISSLWCVVVSVAHQWRSTSFDTK